MKLKTRTYSGHPTDEITSRETSHRQLARRAATEGFVLLKNDGGLLPLSKETPIALYGAGALKTIKGGTGSGDVNERDSVTIYQGLKQAGYSITSESWLSSYTSLYDSARNEWKERIFAKLPEFGGDMFNAYSTTVFEVPCGLPLDSSAAQADGADTALFVISRIAGENADRHDLEGDYFITKEEKALLDQVAASYENVVLVINTGGLMDLAFTEETDNIKAIIQYVQAGQEGGNAFADILCGDVTPSGKMTDSWALTYSDYPNAMTFSHKNGNTDTEKYEEGIYVGYRYFDSFDMPVRYCFGYGLSYTDFEISTASITAVGLGSNSPKLLTDVTVKNTGSRYAGKEVVQIYVSCPQGSLAKEYRRLAAFGKTSLLHPGESQSLKLTFDISQLASYCGEKAAWILEAGTYGIWVGNSLDDAKLVGSVGLDQESVLVQCRHICPLKEELQELAPAADKMKKKEEAWLAQVNDLVIPPVSIQADQLPSKQISYSDGVKPLEGSAGQIVDSLSEEQLIALATGEIRIEGGSALGSSGITVPGSAAETSASAGAEPWNLASIALADGPAGLRLSRTYEVEDGQICPQDFFTSVERGFLADCKESGSNTATYYQNCTAIPVGTLLAQSWNTQLVKELGEMIGTEMELFHVSLWLAPGMNIHRNPLCGRNFEYYSEDPLLSGMMASAMTLGVQTVPGCGTTIKHFACNNQEDNRMGSDSVLSERALREIYLKGFEIAVKNSQPMSIMTSYNMINGIHAANCFDLCSSVTRDEWGFAGGIMTDWCTTNNSPRGISTASGCMRAGNDMVMPGFPMDHDNLRDELHNGTLDIMELKQCIYNTVRIILQSNQYEDAVSYLSQFSGLDEYMTAE